MAAREIDLVEFEQLDADGVAGLIGISTDQWPGSCYAIACKILRTGLIEGNVRYGHWLGPVADDSVFDASRPFQRHGWIEKENGEIVDPTRWVFEAVEPYIYIGENDYYDMGGNKLREASLSPPPPYDPKAERCDLEIWKIDPKAEQFVKRELLGGTPGITKHQAFWIANLPLSHLEHHAEAIYTAFQNAGMGALIPIDNRDFVLGKDPK